MDAAATPRKPRPSDLLLATCQVLESRMLESEAPTARVRLEAALGRDLTRRLVQALSAGRTDP